MLVLYPRTSDSLEYFTSDPAHELAPWRDGGPRWSPRGDGGMLDAVLQGTARSRYVGYDLVVAAPRMTSALLAVGTTTEARAVIAEHRRAVTVVLDYLEERALVWHRQRYGERATFPGAFERVVAFTHGANRAGEPHLHDHVLFAAKTRGAPYALDGQALRAHLPAADALYQAALRDALTRRVGRPAWRSFRGRDYVEGIDEAVRGLWPGRGAERLAKRHWDIGELEHRWSTQLARVEPVAQFQPPVGPRDRVDAHALGSLVMHLDGIRRFDAVAALAAATPFGVEADRVRTMLDEQIPRWRPARGFGGPVLAPARLVELARTRTHQIALHHEREERSREGR